MVEYCCCGFRPAPLMDVADTVEEMLEQHAEVSRRLYTDGLCLMRHWHTVRKGHEVAEERYVQACRAAELEAVQCAALSALKPAEWKLSAEKTIQSSRQAVAAEKEFQKTLHKFNTSVELQEKQMSLVLDAAQDMEEKRALCFKDAVMKIAVFDTSWLRNVQYDIDSCVQALEESDGVTELQEFIRRNRTQVPMPASRAARPHWELAGRREPKAFQERELQRQRQEEFRPLLHGLLGREGDQLRLPSQDEVARVCSLLAGTASREGASAREPSAVVRAGFCGALRAELNPTASADVHGEPPSAAVLCPEAFDLATALFKAGASYSFIVITITTCSTVTITVIGFAASVSAATDGADAECDVWNGRDLLVLSKFIQLRSSSADDTEEPRDDVLLRIYDHPLWSRVTFWDDLLLAGLAEAHFQLVLSRWADPQGLSGSLSGFATCVDAASAKREIQEVVMTPFLQRYMAYMISLGISFQQAKGATTRTLQKHVELLGTSHEAYLRLITHDAEAIPRAFSGEAEKHPKEVPAPSTATPSLSQEPPPAPSPATPNLVQEDVPDAPMASPVSSPASEAVVETIGCKLVRSVLVHMCMPAMEPMLEFSKGDRKETGGLQHASRLHEAQGKLILDLLKGGPNRNGPSAEAKAQPRHHRSGGAFVLLKQGELWLDVSQRQLSDEDLLGILTDRFCKAVHDKASTSRSIAPDMWYLNIDVSQNRLTGRGISLLLDLFERLNDTFRAGGKPFIVPALSNSVFVVALLVARFITVQRAPLHELHLSHNEIGQEGAEAILRAFGTHPTRSYPFQLLINKSLFGSMAKEVAGDPAFAAGIFKNCFGRGGDFTMVVEEPQGEDSCGSEVKRVEFKVMSPLLASWSVVFDKMISSEFVEQQKAQAFQKGLQAEDACQLFASAARYQLADLRKTALEKIWIEAGNALKQCPNISPEVLKEILQPGLICMCNADLRVVLQGWTTRRKRKAGEEATLPWSLQPVIDRHFDRMKDEAVRLAAEEGEDGDTPEDQLMARYSDDIFNSLWVERESENAASPFLGYYVTVVFGRKGCRFCVKNPGPLEQYVSNRKPFELEGPDSITWMLPHESVYLTGLSFARNMPEHVHCKIFCSQDGMSWHLAADTTKSKINAETALRLDRPPHLVKWFKLEVIPDPSGLLKAIGELGVRITPTTDRRGGDFGPGRAPSWATSPDVVPHAVLSWQYHQVSAVAANRNPRGSTPQEQHAQQMAQDAATALNSAFLKGLLNPAPAASEGEDWISRKHDLSAARQRHPREPQFSESSTEQRGLPAAGPRSIPGGPLIWRHLSSMKPRRNVGLQSPSGQQSAGGHGANKIGRLPKEDWVDLDEAPAMPASSAPARSQKGRIAARVKGALLAAQAAATPQADTEGRGPPIAAARPPPPPPIQTTTLLSTTPPDAPLTPERAQDAVRREPEGLRQAKEVVASLDTCNDGEVMGRWLQHLERSRDPMKEAEKIMKMLRCLVRQGFCASSADRQAARGVPAAEASVTRRSSRTSPRDPPGPQNVEAAEIISQLQRLAAQSHAPAPSMMAQRIPPAPLDSLGTEAKK
eukprot:s1184_g2.t5